MEGVKTVTNVGKVNKPNYLMDLLPSVEVSPPGGRFVSNLQTVLLSKETQSLHIGGNCGHIWGYSGGINRVETRCDLQRKGEVSLTQIWV